MSHETRPNDQKPCESEAEDARGLAQKPITPSLSKCNHIPSSKIPNSRTADTQVLRTSLASRVATALMPSMPSLCSPQSKGSDFVMISVTSVKGPVCLLPYVSRVAGVLCDADSQLISRHKPDRLVRGPSFCDMCLSNIIRV